MEYSIYNRQILFVSVFESHKALRDRNIGKFVYYP